jgi:hypothetical protein
MYKLQYPQQQQAKLQELDSVQSWWSVIYITVSQVHIIWIKPWSVYYTTPQCVEEFSMIKTKQDRPSLSLSPDFSRNRREEREHPSSANEGLSNHKATGWWH